MFSKKFSFFAFIILLSNFAFAQHPEWSLRTNIYEVNVRQFSQEGTFAAFQQALPRLKDMGVEILWFMPITPIGIKERKMSPDDLGSYYAVKDYKDVNPEFGTLNDFKKLVDRAHAMGFKVITDWVANHSAPDNHWVDAHPAFYTKDNNGKFVSPYDWTDVYQLDYNNMELRDSMIDAMQFWIRETNIDGFRCDVAEPVPASFWKDCITKLRKMKSIFMLAEGNTAWLHEAGFDATYNWNAMNYTKDLYTGKINATAFMDSLNNNAKQYPTDAMRLNFTTNHDENSWNGTEFEKYGDAYKMFAVFTMTYHQSIPLIYNGQEIPNKKRLKFFVKDPIEWTGLEMEDFYKRLLFMRNNNAAMGLEANFKKLHTNVDGSVLSYVRTAQKGKVVVMLNLTASPQTVTIQDDALNGRAVDLFSGNSLILKSGQKQQFDLAPWGFTVLDYGQQHGNF